MFNGIKELFLDDMKIDIKDVLLKNNTKLEEFKREPYEFKIIDNSGVFKGLEVKQDDFNNIQIAMLLNKYLPKYIYGQKYAIKSIVNYFKHNLVKSKGPKASFLFLGPSAIGKSYTAEVISKLIKGYKYKVFDMSQFIREDSGIGLYGADFKYTNAAPGELTNFVLNNPKSIIIFEDIEKAHTTIQNNLLSIFSTGKLKDKNGWVKYSNEYVPFNSKNMEEHNPEVSEVDFSQTILIFTSNVGKELYNSLYFWDLVDNNSAENMIIEALQKEMKIQDGQNVLAITPSFLSRISSGGLAFFKKLEFEHILKITRNVFNKNLEQFKIYYNLEVEGIIDFIYAIFLLSFSPKIDIRRIKSKVVGEFFDVITDYILENTLELQTKKKVKVEISENVKDYFFKHLKPLLEDDILKYMFRKNLTLKIDKKLEYKENIFIYKITNIFLEKVQNVKDIGDEGIIFEVPEVRFEDIAGHKKVKKKLQEIVSFMKNPKEIQSLGIDIPKGILFYGPPGTGKTMLAKAVAKEAELPFLATTGSDLLNIEKMENIFDIARDYSPSIVFIDEFDAIGSRNKNNNREIYINKLLSKINGFQDNNDVFIIAATNYPENIDSALLRSGRIDIKIEIKSLDKEARKDFITKMISLYNTDSEFDIDKLVLYTTGLNGADLEKIKRECAIYLIKEGITKLTQNILIEIINIVKYGDKIESDDIKKTLESTAIHEAGHAVVSKILNSKRKIEQITITPRDNSLGFISYDNEEDYKNISKSEIKKEIQILLAGRVAQIKKYGEEGIDSGASNDLLQATNLVYHAITILGMDDEVGYINISEIPKVDFDFAKRIQYWLKEAEINVKTLIDENWDNIQKVANKLLEEESIDEEELINCLSI